MVCTIPTPRFIYSECWVLKWPRKDGGSSQKGQDAVLSITESKLCFVGFFISSVSMVTAEVRVVRSWAKYSFCKVNQGSIPGK